MTASGRRLLDLFCGAGGAAMGYHRAGFEVVGVDIKPQPNYPFEFHQMDVMSMDTVRHVLGSGVWLDGSFQQFDVIHASPPCQRYIRSGNVDRERHPDLLGPVRELLKGSGLPWVIENVPGAPMRPELVLCGSMFDLQVRRHRWFESSFGLLPWTLMCNHTEPVTGVYGNPHGANGAYPGMLPSDLETWSRAMDIDWMTTVELADAIPPAYTKHVGWNIKIALWDRDAFFPTRSCLTCNWAGAKADFEGHRCIA